MVKLRFVEPISRVRFPLATHGKKTIRLVRIFFLPKGKVWESKDGSTPAEQGKVLSRGRGNLRSKLSVTDSL